MFLVFTLYITILLSSNIMSLGLFGPFKVSEALNYIKFEKKWNLHLPACSQIKETSFDVN